MSGQRHSRGAFQRHPGHPQCYAGSINHVTCKLATCGVDIVTPRLAYRSDYSCISKRPCKLLYR
jgi:hypothetical protein